MTPPPFSLWTWLLGNAFVFGLAAAAYATGIKIARLRRVTHWTPGPGRPIPPQLQTHMAWGFLTGLFTLLVTLNAFSLGVGGPASVAFLAGVALSVLTGAARTFLGGSGTMHLVVTASSGAALAAALVAFIMQAVASLPAP